MTDERPDSLAAQAASWVPPWERASREPDRDYQAAADEPDIPDSVDQPDSVEQPDEGTKVDEAGLSDDDDDFDEAFEGPNPPAYEEEVPPELAALPGEADGPATVDAPQELPGEEEPEPTDVGGGSELPLPIAVEEASEQDADDDGVAVDAPLPADGDDAGDVFDLAADDDVSDDDDVDLPFTEVVPDADGDGDDAAALAADDEPFADYPGDPADGDPAQEGVTPSGDVEADTRVDGESAAAGGERVTPEGDVGSLSGGGAEVPLLGDEGAGGAERKRRARSGSGIPAQGRGSGGSGAAVGAPEKRTNEPDSALPPMDDHELRAALEAILLVVDEPVAEMQLAQIMEQPTERVASMLEDISARYTAAGHGFDLRRAAGGWRLYTRPEYAAYVERFVLDGQSVRLTQAALETLAVVAYKQPVTRSRISAIRGVNCDGVMRTLVTRGLIEECGTESETGAFLYRTTPLFLEKLGLNSVDQLPPLAPFLPDDVEEVLDASG